MFNNDDNNNSRQPHEFAGPMAQAILESCELAANVAGGHPADYAHDAIIATLIMLANMKEDDSVCVLVKKQGDYWRSHVHYDYLSSDHDHFANDFSWDAPEAGDDH
jgi:hypothetical protein